MDWGTSFLLILAAAFGLTAIGVPIAAAMGLVGFAGLFIIDPRVASGAVGITLNSSLRNFSLTAVPMFVLMAEILIFSDITRRLFDNASKLFGGLPGSLLLGSRLVTTLLSAVTGSSVASSAAIGTAAIPEMIKRGYDPRLTVGSVAAGGGLAIVMPPSIVLIVYGFIAEVSVAKLFIAGVFPALIMAAAYTGLNLFTAIRRPDLAPRMPAVPPAEWFRALAETGPTFGLAAVIMGSIYAGFATVTEAAGVGVLGALVLASFSGKLTVANMRAALLGTARITGFVFLIIIGALIFAFLITYLKIPAHMTELIVGLGLNRWVVLALVMIIFLLLGTFMEPLPTLLVVVPIVIGPLKLLGFDPVWLGVLLTVVLEMGLTMPPFGINLFVVQGTAAYVGHPVSYSDAVAGSAPYFIADGLALLVVILFPATVLWLPQFMG